MVRLHFLSGSLQGTETRWEQQVVRLGRAPDCDVRLDGEGREVSGHHAEIVREEGGYLILDTASKNGTWVNGERVDRRRLASGDLVVLGGSNGVQVRIELAPGEVPAPAPTPLPLASTIPGTPLPRPGPTPAPLSESARFRASTRAARVADDAAQKVVAERAKAGGKSSGHTLAIIADAVEKVHHDTRRHTGRRWAKIVVAVAGAGLVAAGVMGVIIFQQRREIRRLISQKQGIDQEIASVQKAMEHEVDPDKLVALEQRLAELSGSAESTLGELARQDREKAQELEQAGEAIDRDIRRILVKFDAQTYAVPPVFRQALQEQVEVLAKASNLKFIYKRRNRYWPLIKREFAALGLPEEMAYIAWAETQFDPDQTSPAGARGMWQMTASTARELGLKVADGVDERVDVHKQTRAAARKLANLLAEFGSDSFMLAMASYNRGEAGVRRVLREVAQEKGGFRKEKRDFWHLYRLKRLPTETMDYVPRVLAAAVVCNDPQRFGLDR